MKRAVRRIPRDISQGERKRILARVKRFGIEAGRTKADIKGMQNHLLMVNRFVRALARELIRKGAAIDYRKLSRASLWHDAVRQRVPAMVNFMTGEVKPSRLLGSEKRTAQDYIEEFHEKVARELLKRGNKREREAAKLIGGRKWIRFNKPKARKHITLEQLIIDLGDAVVEGKNFVQIRPRFESMAKRMSAYSEAEITQYRRASRQLEKMVKKMIEEQYGVDLNAIIERLQKTRG